MSLLSLWLGMVVPSEAAPFWELPEHVGYTLGVSLVVNLGPAGERSRFGVAVDGGYQRFWHEGPYYYDVANHPSPLFTAAIRVGWTHPVVFAEVTGAGGVIQPSVVGDAGFQPLFGGQVGAGLGLATDGWAGPVLFGTILGPWIETRLEAELGKEGLHTGRGSIGVYREMNCCAFLL